MSTARDRLSEAELNDVRRRRRQPRRSQFDFLHLRELLEGLRAATAEIPDGSDVLDVFCGSKPYEHLVPSGCRYVGMDVTDEYGVADVVSEEFLPFEDRSFDVALCTEAFYYVPDPEEGVAELLRVLRPGGRAILTLPLVWEYDRAILEHRYTGPELLALFDGWDDVAVRENGGRVVAWATLTGVLIRAMQRTIVGRGVPEPLVAAPFGVVYRVLNAVGAALDRFEARYDWGTRTLPMNVMVTARRPAG